MTFILFIQRKITVRFGLVNYKNLQYGFTYFAC
jgi:hypothetical protein